MESSELYHVKQQFLLGAYKTLVDLTLPDPSSPDYTPTLIYKARAQIALGHAEDVAKLLPADSEDVTVKAVGALARWMEATGAAEKDASLEELRDLCVEIEGEDAEADEKAKGIVRVLAGTAFALAGEIEEALETLGAGTNTDNLEAVALTVQIYLSINRPDLARKEFDRAKRWAEDDLLLQLIESSIGLVTGKDGYADCNSFYTEQLGNPSLSSPHLLTARGVTRLLRGEISAAKSDFEEAVSQQGGTADAETLAAMTVAAGLGASKHAEVDQLFSRMVAEHPSHPFVVDVNLKAALFDECAAKFQAPPLFQQCNQIIVLLVQLS
ncbi:coatomer epsilon subunit-domain-containing protein [Amylocystis lapponica]|nr:coatomer epsilon subunit-domain-containing protein [Amylocystis lapponica]